MTTKSDFKNHVNKCKKVIQKFGTTRNFENTNFIMPDGLQINAHKGPGTRWDHTEVSIAYAKIKSFPKQEKEMERFMNQCGAVRIRKYPMNDGSVVRVHSIKKPTEKQAKKLVQSVKNSIRFYGFMETETEHHACESTIDNPTGLDIRRWIHKCWR